MREEELALPDPVFFVLRTPLLPVEDLDEWSARAREEAGLSPTPKAQGERELDDAAVERYLSALRRGLRRIVRRPEVAEAIYVASPQLCARMQAWLANADSPPAPKLELALIKYLLRMTSRATPYGLFAGVSSGVVGTMTDIELSDRATWRRHARLEVLFLTSFCSALSRSECARDGLRLLPNPSIYRVGGQIRYLRSNTGEEQDRTPFFVESVDETDYLNEILRYAEGGKTAKELTRFLAERWAPLPEARAFVEELIDSQVLISELRPAITGCEPLTRLIRDLRDFPQAAPYRDRLRVAHRMLRSLNASPLGADPAWYERIGEVLADLPLEKPVPQLVQVDLHTRMCRSSLGRSVVREILRAAGILSRVGGTGSDPFRDQIESFRDAFIERYGDREVPLLEVADDESGIGWNGQAADSGGRRARESEASVSPRDHYLAELVGAGRPQRAMELELSRADVEELASLSKGPALSDCAFAAAVQVAARSRQALNSGEFSIYLRATLGVSGIEWFARFVHGDRSLRRALAAHLRREEALRGHAAHAEVVYQPPGRIANVLVRPNLRRYEVPYLGRSGLSKERLIPVSDLLVSVVGERVRLRSASTGLEVIPRISSAHYPLWAPNPGVYRLLYLLQYQDGTVGRWSWGALDRVSAFLPRVRVGRTILALARWRLSRTEVDRLVSAPTSAARFREMRGLRAERGLPRYVVLPESDNTLVIDLENPATVDVLCARLKRGSESVLTELFPSPDELIVSGADGHYFHELIVPFCPERRLVRNLSRPADAITVPTVRRTYSPGSEWLYLKLYCGRATADRLLRTVILDVSEEFLRQGIAEKWFFIRYADPGFHIRLRYRGDPKLLTAAGLPELRAIFEPYLESRAISRLQVDTYEREVERYGGNDGIELAETIFWADSHGIARALRSAGAPGFEDRVRLALVGVDVLLQELGFDIRRRLHLMEQLLAAQEAATEERHMSARRLFSAEYRRERSVLEGLLSASTGNQRQESHGAVAILRARFFGVRDAFSRLLEMSDQGCLTRNLDELAGSLCHMHVNRILRDGAGRNETMIYEFLRRLYTSDLAKRRQTATH